MSNSKKRNLFDDDGGDAEFTINQDYAKRYEKWREAEIKETLKNKYGDGDVEDDLSSDDTSSDDEPNPEELKGVLSKDFLELMANLKKKDPKIYNPQVEFFKNQKEAQNNRTAKASKDKTKEKPLYLRDYERKIITERQGELSDESDTENKEDPRSQSPTYVEEQRQLQASFKKALNDEEESGDEGEFLKKKEKTKEEKKKEEEDYIEWLKGNKESLPDKEMEASLMQLKTEWNDPKLDENEKFLRDYILNRRYLEDGPVNDGNVTDDDIEDEKMDDFERKHNFRFEEPDTEFLKRYPRTMEQSVRQKDTRRKEIRDARKQRKEEEKLAKREELKLLKSIKRKEILEKIEKIKQITGNDDLGLDPDDLNEDFDPEAHDRKMKEMFNDDYYGGADDAEDEDGLNLPPLEEELLDDGVADGNWDNWDGTDGNVDTQEEELAPHCEDPDFNMDCDYDPATAQKQSIRKSEKRKLKRQSRFGRLVHKKKPVFDPNDQTFQQYVDEYYGMDYEDLIGDIPCRFKYKSVFPNSFGLTIDEILAADDKELNQWVSIKKAYTIRPESTEKYEARIYSEKAKNEELKRKILPSLYKHETENVNQNNEKKKKKKKKKSNENESADVTLAEDADETVDQDPSTSQAEGSREKKKKNKKHKSNENGNAHVTLAEDANETVDQDQSTSQAEGSREKKKKNKKHKSNENGCADVTLAEDANETVDQDQSTPQAEGSEKKKKKKNKKESNTVTHTPHELTGNTMKRKRLSSEVEHQNGVKKAKTSFSQGAAGKKKFKNGNGKGKANQQKQDISDARLKAYGLNPKRFKNFHKYGPGKDK